VVRDRWARTLEGEASAYRLEFGDPSRFRRVYDVRHTPLRDSGGAVVAAVEEALRSAGGDKVAAAKILGVSRATLYRHLPKRMGGS
jgi:transcriptional regulator of acetoin/glycerol metabolism